MNVMCVIGVHSLDLSTMIVFHELITACLVAYAGMSNAAVGYISFDQDGNF